MAYVDLKTQSTFDTDRSRYAFPADLTGDQLPARSLQHRPPRHQRELMGSLDQGEPPAVQRQHAPVDAFDLVTGLDVDMFKAGARGYVGRSPCELARLERLEHVPGKMHLAAFLSRQPLLDQPLPPCSERCLHL